MGSNKIAVAVIHGMGSQGKDKQGVDEISFSAGLYTRLRERLGEEFFEHVGWREVFWADILQERQEEYADFLGAKGARWMKARRFIMHNLADAASYRRSDDPNARTYELIHKRVHQTIERLQQITDDKTPLIVLAHSLGGHIMSNYIHDMSKNRPEHAAHGHFQQMKTMAGFVTFGCNIPVFAFAYPPDKFDPITFPGTRIDPNKRPKPWWHNFNDKDDALGMPLAGISTGYGALAASGELRDTWIDVGNVVEFWNPASHNAYWTDRHFYRPVASILKRAMEIGPVTGPVTGPVAQPVT